MAPTIIEALKLRRLAAKMTQKQAAELANVDEKTYRNIEKGYSDLKLRNYMALLDGLKLTDLDICLDCLAIDGPSCVKLAAVARLLSEEEQAALINMILVMKQDKLFDGS